MAVYGFSIFLGFFPIAIYTLIFVILFTFKSLRDNLKLYYDAMFSGAMAVYLSVYYVALNYPEDENSDGSRNLLMCILITLVLKGFLIAAVSWMTAAAFWTFLRVKSDQVPPNINVPPGNDNDRTVRFEVPTEEPARLAFYRNLNNRTLLFVTVATVLLPGLHLLVDIFSGSDADTINSEQKCWIGAGGGELMYIFIFIPTLIAILLTISLYIWSGLNHDKGQFISSKPLDTDTREIQLRIILVIGIGLWWLIELPALAKASGGAIQHLNGIVNIPLSCLGYYIFIHMTPDVEKTWDRNFPLGKRAKKEGALFWKYYIYRPVVRKVYTLRQSTRKNSIHSSKSDSVRTSPMEFQTNRTFVPSQGRSASPDSVQRNDDEVVAMQAFHYSQESIDANDRQEFQDPNIYINDNASDSRVQHELQPPEGIHLQSVNNDAPQYDTVDEGILLDDSRHDYNNSLDHNSPVYIDPVDLPNEKI